jgi:murein DD-endopeptidase MepM/ murein hydrolase activator NlpD
MALTVEKQPLRTASYRCIVKGTLNSSLSQDMFELGVGDALVAKLADIFAWDINFFIDPRKGDRFEVVFEKLYREGRFVAYGDILAAKYENRGTAKWAIAFDGGEGNRCYYGLDGTSVQKQFLKAPLRYRRVSSGYSLHRRHPILGIIRPHLGIDYAAPQGTPVYAAADGKVTFVGREGGFGNLVRIAHGGAYETSYGHLNNFAKGLHRNSRVAQGELVGTVGATGLATGPHLDYRMKRNGAFIDPQAVKLPAKKGVEPRDMGRFEAVKQTYMTLLERRFPKDGYFVLDIETVPSKDTAMTHISITAQKSDGTAEGS